MGTKDKKKVKRKAQGELRGTTKPQGVVASLLATLRLTLLLLAVANLTHSSFISSCFFVASLQ
jgi:hypothetical protein